MQFRIAILTSLATASSFLSFAHPASAQYSKVCGITKGGFVAQYELYIYTTTSGQSSGWSSGVADGDQKCYTAQDVYGSNAVPANSMLKLYVKAETGQTVTCSPDDQKYSATGGTIKYQADGTTDNVSCQKK